MASEVGVGNDVRSRNPARPSLHARRETLPGTSEIRVPSRLGRSQAVATILLARAWLIKLPRPSFGDMLR